MIENMYSEPEIKLIRHLRGDDQGEPIDVRLSYEIISLFSEGLYQSPHKAIEELVSNSFDAGAQNVYVILPRSTPDVKGPEDSLWVIDDGTGMDELGFESLWKVAKSNKSDGAKGARDRYPIGQFGIGKLAAYVLAWRLTHVSKVKGSFRYTSMDFHRILDLHQYDEQKPLSIKIHEIPESEARLLLAEIETRSPQAWDRLFGENAVDSWTAAALSDFKDLYNKLVPGVLRWVLRTGLPLSADFNIWLDVERLESAKVDFTVLQTFAVGSLGPKQDKELKEEFGIEPTAKGVKIPGLKGEVTGVVTLYEKPLNTGKATQYGRSHGFFIKVRNRVINLEDELFGIEALNHSVWARFVMTVDADGLRDYLLSSREGVREGEGVANLREYLKAAFNVCRGIWQREQRRELVGLDIKVLLNSASPSILSTPILTAVKAALVSRHQPTHYIAAPTGLSSDEEERWLEEFEGNLTNGPVFEDLKFERRGPYDQLAQYDVRDRNLIINEEHPFISKIIAHSKNQTPATLFATSEVLTDALLQESGIDRASLVELFVLRDRALRQIAGDSGPDPVEVIRQLAIADQDKDALERAVGVAFLVMGYQYERRGQNRGGPDGVLDARLGRSSERVEDYRLVYDAKTTSQSSVPADKINLAALWDFKESEGADYAFVVAKKFEGQDDPGSSINKRVRQQVEHDQPVTLILTTDLRRIVELHYRYGVTMTQIRQLFDSAHTASETTKWVDNLEYSLKEQGAQVPLKLLLERLEEAKEDKKGQPNVHAIRYRDEVLQLFEPEKLIAALHSVQVIIGPKWLEVNPTSGDVQLGHTADQIRIEVERRLSDMGLA